ncbi:MAG: MOSC domain-containing protein [Actinomycetota bacterium]|nr:MOSC domain-containing protein [Actinomycetota bacterium]
MAKPTLISVNAGRPADLTTGRRTLRSAIAKQPVDGPVRLRETGLDGDEQADRENHGGRYKAAYAYAREDQAWWEAQLRRAIPPALLGETLTTEGLDVNGAEIGERWRIGAAEVTVSGPRVPCIKLASRMSDPLFVRRFTRAARPGAYLTVVGEGDVRAGDPIEVLERPGHGVTVATWFTIVLLERDRLDELDPARPWFNPELVAFLEHVRG